MDDFVGEIQYFAGTFAPTGWVPCNGRLLLANMNQMLYSLIGNRYGGNGQWIIAVPTLPARPSLNGGTLLPIIAIEGIFPGRDGNGYPIESTLGEMRLMAFTFPPTGWAFCDGQLLSVGDNDQLFSAIGPTYGGDGTTTFAVPNLGNPQSLPPGTTTPLPDLKADAIGSSPVIRWCIATSGHYPNPDSYTMDSYIGMTRRWPATAPIPKGWVPCDGRLLSLNQNYAVFSILDKRYGGDGVTNFAVPNLPVEDGCRWLICIAGLYPVAN